MPPRDVPMKTAGQHIECVENGENIAEFDLDVVIGGIGIVGRQSAAAVVERDNAPAVGAQPFRQHVEIGGGAGQARQANDRRRRIVARAIAARVQPQSVARSEEDAFAAHWPAIYGRRGSGG